MNLSPARADYPGSGSPGNGYPSSGGGSYPGSGAWKAFHCDSTGADIPNETPSASYPLQGTQSVTNSDNYPILDLGSSYPHVNVSKQSLPALETDSHGNKDYGIGFDNYLDQVRAQNYVFNSYGYWVGTIPYTDGFGNTFIAGPWNGTVTRDATGQIAAYLQWRYVNTANNSPLPVPVGSLPPDHMNILLQTRVAASTYVLNTAYAEASATDGDPFQETAGPGQTVLGYHLVRATTGANNIVETYLNGTVHMLARNLVPFSSTVPYAVSGPAEAEASAFVAAYAGQDSRNREVYITCPAIDTPASYSKGAVDSQHPTGQWPHIRSADGSMVTDSLAIYSDADNAHSWIGNATLTANVPGFINPSYSWTSDFNPVAMVGVNMNQQSIPASWFLGAGSQLPITKSIGVTVQDGPGTDGATASNSYSIQWHQPFEEWTDYQPAVAEEIDTISPSSYPSGIPGSQVAYADQVFHCDFEFAPNQMADGIQTAQKILPVTQPFFSPIWQSLIAAAGQPFDKALLGVTTSHDVVNDSDAFTEATYLTSIGKDPLVPRDASGNFQTHEKYAMVDGLLSAHYKRQFLQGDAYDIHGYAGPSPAKTSRTRFKVQATGRYVFLYAIAP